MTTKNWAVSKKSSTTVSSTANTAASRYPVVSYKPFRKFATRAAARDFKQTQNDPSRYYIIDTVQSAVVR